MERYTKEDKEMTEDTILHKLTAARVQLILNSPFFGNLATKLVFIEDNNMPIKTIAVNIHGDIHYHKDFIVSRETNELKFIMAHEVMHMVLAHITRRDNRDIDTWLQAADYAVNGLLVQSGMRAPPNCLYSHKFDDMSAEQIYDIIKQEDGERNDEPFDTFDEPRSGDGDTEAEIRAVIVDWEEEAVKSAIMAKGRGKLPAGIEAIINKLLHVKTDWVAVLHQFVNASARNDYRLYPPNKKHLYRGFIMPGIRSEAIEFAIAIDTSGSVDEEMLSKFLSNVQAILDMNLNMTLHYYECDADVQVYREYHNGDEIEMKVKGRGGTDFRPVFTSIAEKDLEISCLVFFTDTMGAFPDEKPEYPTLWLITEDCVEYLKDRPMPFGEVVVMEE